MDFDAPSSLVERADAVAELLEVSRTRLLVEALEERLSELEDDETFRRRVREAYYDGRVDYDTVESVLGTETAMRLGLLRASLDREPPEPELADELPTVDAFYEEGQVPRWTGDEDR